MTAHSETRIVPYTADLMFQVVADVEQYPSFLPWVVALRVLSREHIRGCDGVNAEMAVGVAHITGDAFVQTASGTLALRVTGDGRNDALGTAAGGTVTLAGTFRALVQPGLYASNTTYINVVTSGSNITTQFDNVTSSSPFFAAGAVYNLQSVDLNLSRIPFGSVPMTTIALPPR